MKFLLFSLSLLFLISCEQNEIIYEEVPGEAVCGTTNPLQVPEWLKALITEGSKPVSDDYCHLFSVSQGVYKGEKVFITYVGVGALCCTCAGGTVKNCEGEVIFSCDLREEAKIKNIKVIWEREK